MPPFSSRTPRTALLPDFPWDSLSEATALAQSHPEGMINLSVGTPVDPVAPHIQLALAESAAAPGYPQTKGTSALRQSIVSSLERRYGVLGLDPEKSVLPVIGTKEVIAWLPFLLGMGHEDIIVIPELAYPTYEVSARLCGAQVRRSDSLFSLGPEQPSVIYINSPANPHGKVLGIDHLKKMVSFAQDNDVLLLSDECYLGLGWETPVDGSAGTTIPVSILDPRVSGGNHRNLIAIHSLSKTSNMASYRAGFLAGDSDLIQELLEIRKHAGLMVPGPIQEAMIAALDEDDHETWQKHLYSQRRKVLAEGLEAAGFRIDHSEAGLYLWATEDRPCRESVQRLASEGILVAPGEFYGPQGKNHIRVGLTGTDEQIQRAVQRLNAMTRV